jgi:hypothetical protein
MYTHSLRTSTTESKGYPAYTYAATYHPEQKMPGTWEATILLTRAFLDSAETISII